MIKRQALVLAMGMFCTSASAQTRAGDIIPRPTVVRELPGQFILSAKTYVGGGDDSAAEQLVARQIVELLGKPLDASLDNPWHPPTSITLTLQNADKSLGDEGYELLVHPDEVTIRATTATGLFYGAQSLRQLLPPEIERREKVSGISWAIPCVEIKDSPRYPWRGLMLDVARHFFDKAEVKHLLDLMALYKLNRFHWHLTDDQGWRIEILKYPKLTELGAWREGIGFNLDPKRTTHYRADGKYGGFYTQEEIKEVVAYAAQLQIKVIPEIEMPGHSQAALSAYPQFSCTKSAFAVGVKAGVMDAIYDPGAEGIFTFLSDVLDEVHQLFPASYIHIGGDEVPKGPWKKAEDAQALMKVNGLKNEDELQSYFIKRVEQIVQAKQGKRMIGWDEILEGGLAPNATVMSWRGTKGGIEAARAGHDVIMTPTSNCYFDYAQTRVKGQPPTGGGYLPLATVYAFEPTPRDLSTDAAKHILGGQGNLWTEYVPNMKQVELMAFPRTLAMAEATWSRADRKDFTDFSRRWANEKKRLKELGVNYFEEPAPALDPIGTWSPEQMSETPTTLQWDASKVVTQPGEYQVTMQYTGGACRLDIMWIALQADGVEVCRDTHNGRTGAADKNNTYDLPLNEHKPGVRYTLLAHVRSDGGIDSTGTVTIAPVR